MRTQTWIIRAGLITAAFCIASPALAQGGKGGYAKITPLPGTMEISVNNDGKKYYVIDQPITVSFKVQGAPGKRRKMNSWEAGAGLWRMKVNKPGTYTRSLTVKDVYDRRKLAQSCEQLLAAATASKNKTKDTLRNNGWTDTFTYNLVYKTRMVVHNPHAFSKITMDRLGEDSQGIVVRCLGYERQSEPRPNKKTPKKDDKKASNETRNKKSSKASGDVTLKGSQIAENDDPLPDRMNPDRMKPTRAKLSGDGDRQTQAPKSDLFARSGGINPDDGTSYILLIGNQGPNKSTATEIRFFMNMNEQDTLSAQYPIPELAPGKFYELHIPSVIPLDWIETAYARIDQPDVNNEADETNNGFGFIKARKTSTIADTDERAPYYKIKMEKAQLYERPPVDIISFNHAKMKESPAPLRYSRDAK